MRAALGLAALLLGACGPRPPLRPAAPASSVRLVAAGDVLLDRGVRARQLRHGEDYPFSSVAALLGQADLAVANLEGPITSASCLAKPYSFRFPPSAAGLLARSGLDVLSLANNHVLDCGRPGLLDTLAALRRAGLHGYGAGADARRAMSPLRLEVHRVRVAFLGFTVFLPEGLVLRDDAATVAFADPEQVRAAVAGARAASDVVVVSLHFGVEHAHRPSERQETLVRAAMEGGADLVLGHHPHVLQGLQVWPPFSRGRAARLAAYSLGNFVFDQQLPAARESLLLSCELGPEGLRGARVVPLRIDEGRPRPASAAERGALLGRLAGLSAELGARLDGDTVRLR